MYNSEFKERLIQELKEDLAKRDFTLNLTEKGLEDLERFYTKIHFEQKLIPPSYFRQFFKHLIVLIGEVYIHKYGGNIIFGSILNSENVHTTEFEKSTSSDVIIQDEVYPIGIKCKNGNVTSGFIGRLDEDIIQELDMYDFVSLMSSYSDIQIECNAKF